MDVSFMMEDNFNLTYVSCIEIDGNPILAPVISEAKRAEMRNYKELAIARELQLKEGKERRNRIQQDLSSSTHTDHSTFEYRISEFVVTKKRQALQRSLNTSISQDSGSVTNNSDDGNQPSVYTTPTDNEVDFLDGNIINRSKVQMSELDSSDSNSSSDGGGGHFASLGSSTGTFIIQSGRKLVDDQDLSDDDENKENEMELLDLSPGQLGKGGFNKKLSMIQSREAILYGEREASYKRKRPASYFDEDNSISRTVTTSTPESESTSLGKYISAANSHASNATITPTDLDRMAVNKSFTPTPLVETFSVDRNSPVINTDFVGAAAQGETLTPRRNDTFSPLTSTVRRQNIFDSPSPGHFAKERRSGNKHFPDDIVLSTSVPSSVEKSPPEKQISLAPDCDNIDKENKSFKKKHIRKLSYTLLAPSAELLAASAKVADSIPLETLMSAPSSVGIPSINATPEKPKYQNVPEPSTPTTQELDARLDNLNHAMHKLQQLNLGKGKKAHLERFLGDQREVEQQKLYQEEKSHEDQNATDEVELRFQKLQEQHEKQLTILAEMHRQQQIKMEQQFAQEKEKLLRELKSHNPSIASSNHSSKELFASPASQKSNWSPKNVHDNDNFETKFSHGDQVQNPSPLKITGVRLTPSSNRGQSSSETHTEKTNINSPSSTSSARLYMEESPPIVATNSRTTFPNVLGGSSSQIVCTPTPEPWGYVGLSKLQARMQALSPSLFKSPADSKSPLLKGLIFLDPLSKPKGAIRIPAQISDPLLKVKFEKVTAAVKGYLTRRLLHSEKIQLLIQTIRDTVALVLRLHEEAPEGHAAAFMVRPQDAELHRRLLQQLGGACNSFHDVFFKLSPTERMAIIATDREKLKAKALKNLMCTNNTSQKKNNISVATLKCLERRLSLNRSASRKENPPKKIRSSISLQSGSQSVKPKVVASYKISPKRRRMSYFDRDHMINNRVTKPGRVSSSNASSDTSRNRRASSSTHKKTSYNPPNIHTSRSDNGLGLRSSNTNANPRSSRSNQETFLIPSSVSSSRSRPLIGSSQPTETSSNRNSLRVPWKYPDSRP